MARNNKYEGYIIYTTPNGKLVSYDPVNNNKAQLKFNLDSDYLYTEEQNKQRQIQKAKEEAKRLKEADLERERIKDAKIDNYMQEAEENAREEDGDLVEISVRDYNQLLKLGYRPNKDGNFRLVDKKLNILNDKKYYWWHYLRPDNVSVYEIIFPDKSTTPLYKYRELDGEFKFIEKHNITSASQYRKLKDALKRR